MDPRVLVVSTSAVWPGHALPNRVGVMQVILIKMSWKQDILAKIESWLCQAYHDTAADEWAFYHKTIHLEPSNTKGILRGIKMSPSLPLSPFAKGCSTQVPLVWNFTHQKKPIACRKSILHYLWWHWNAS